MKHTTPINIIKRTVFSTFAVVLALVYPSAASFADTASTSDTSAGQNQTTTSQPTGDDATTYHYNAATGKWENEHYIWDPATRTTTPKDTLPYSYNPATGRWDTTEWHYNGTAGKWEPNAVSVAQPPAGSQTVGGPLASVTPAVDAADGTTSDSDTIGADPSRAQNSSTSTSYFDGFYNAAISNTITNTAVSGNAAVTSNSSAGDATTGNATAISNVFNVLQSTSGFNDLKGVNTFVTDIDGDVTGDLFVDPAQLGHLQPATAADGMNADTQVNISQDNTITNNLTVGATSGSATVSDNNTAGNATSGSANAVANLVNLINSSIAANQSFIGTLNINGNLNGDILLPPEVLQTLLASNAPTTTVSLSSADKAALDATLTNKQSTSNNVITNATSGNAIVSDNNTAGNAKTGDSRANITVLNLTGRQITGNDSLLVFVNVLGKWVGALINAPQGVTAAALGGGITENNTLPGKTDIAAANSNTITNNVEVTATSGDAAVRHNRTAGDAATGNATASANIANVSNSHVSLGGWFGILFINVFGSWFGSFGVNTDAGGKAPSNNSNTDASSTTPSSTQAVRVFRFTATTTTGGSNNQNGAIAAEVDPQTNTSAAQPQVLGAEITQGTGTGSSKRHAAAPKLDLSFPVGTLSIGGGLFAAERAFARSKHARR